jgi:uncharacterized membrane protein
MKFNSKKLVAAALIGALYAVLTMVIPTSYPPIDFRVSEIMCILPFFFPEAAFGLTVGCVISNLISVAGLPDVIFGSLATLLAGLCTAGIGVRARRRGKIGWGDCIAACAMPVLFNAPIVGAVLAYFYSESEFWKAYFLYFMQIGLSEAGVLFVLGLPAMRYIMKKEALNRLLSGLNS